MTNLTNNYFKNISFEQIVLHIERDEVLDVFEHPNKERYQGQQVLVVEVNGYWI